MLLLTSALALGFLHGLGADHLMAIAALSMGRTGDAPARAAGARDGGRGPLRRGARAAAGAGRRRADRPRLVVAARSSSARGEMLGGVLLIVFGAIGLWSVATDRVYGHTHVQGHDHHAHFHLHVGRRAKHPLPSAHSHLPTFVGAAFAVSSLRALTMLAPFGHRVDTAPVATLLVLIVVFAVGILLSMSLFGVAFARLMSARVVQRLGRAGGAVMAAASIALGVYWGGIAS